MGNWPRLVLKLNPFWSFYHRCEQKKKENIWNNWLICCSSTLWPQDLQASWTNPSVSLPSQKTTVDKINNTTTIPNCSRGWRFKEVSRATLLCCYADMRSCLSGLLSHPSAVNRQRYYNYSQSFCAMDGPGSLCRVQSHLEEVSWLH